MKNLENRVKAIEDRNIKVEADKAWETSWVRRVTIGTLTYAVVIIYLFVINNDKPFLNALVPSVGYILSTLVLKKIRNIKEKV